MFDVEEAQEMRRAKKKTLADERARRQEDATKRLIAEQNRLTIPDEAKRREIVRQFRERLGQCGVYL